jgi:hypothetical protein
VTHPLLFLSLLLCGVVVADERGFVVCVCVCVCDDDDDNYGYGVKERGEPSWLSCHPRLVHLCVKRSDKCWDN